tara:strand:+ start:13944 stop:14453 length:510 start_codon:yes stop_codon:yes gene_type:complete
MNPVFFINKAYDFFVRYFNRHFYHSTIIQIVEVEYRGMDYNLSIDEDETYIADGFLVHNCRSALGYEVDDRFKDDESSKKPSSFEVDGKRDPKPIDSDGIYYENLKQLKESDQDTVLGPTLGKAFRKLDNPSQFAKLMLDDNNRPLTITQLKTRNNALSRILREQSKRD